MSRWVVAGVLVLALAAPASGSDGAPPPPGKTVYTLPRFTTPQHLALGGDGSLWISDEFEGVTQLRRGGRARTRLMWGEYYEAGDVAAASDGSVWIADGPAIVRIAAAGDLLRWPTPGDFEADAIATAGDAAWVGSNGFGGRAGLERRTANGASRRFKIRSPRGVDFGGIAAAPDGSAWFTLGDYYRGEWIGRMTADGRYAHWAAPGVGGAPGRIAAGPDGAMWFTEPHAIGRITTDGHLTRFTVPGAAVPHDIVARGDGSVWFTSDICLARMTSAGEVTTWPVPGAVKLDGLAPAPDGSVWLADEAGGVIRRFSPGAPAPCGAPTFTRRAGATAATVSFERDPHSGGRGDESFSDIRIHIARDGRELFHETVPALEGNPGASDSRSFTVRDLDGDGEPEVMLLLIWNGSNCCSWSRIYRYDRARNTSVVLRHFWGSGITRPALRDLDGDRRPELVSRDDRFSIYDRAMTPIEIWSYRRGALRDVTRRYPGRVRRDAAKPWRGYVKEGRHYARMILPTWVADEYRLGYRAAADRVLAEAAAQGRLNGNAYDVGPRDPWAYISALKALLRRAGYAR